MTDGYRPRGKSQTIFGGQIRCPQTPLCERLRCIEGDARRGGPQRS